MTLKNLEKADHFVKVWRYSRAAHLKSLAGVLKEHSHPIMVCNLSEPWSVWQQICHAQAILVKDSSQAPIASIIIKG
ncbi:MAG: hypothetical protein FRX49_08676 [Trebouxia sp. A1-2]|nr:MAG: hypothetical protein FRX49_08676 [Trebouxia sp. A1-2]